MLAAAAARSGPAGRAGLPGDCWPAAGGSRDIHGGRHEIPRQPPLAALLLGPGHATMTSSQKILIGLGAGIVVGVIVGEEARAIEWAAEGFVRLLQMTVLPYVTVSIIGSLGALSPPMPGCSGSGRGRAPELVGDRSGLHLLIAVTVSQIESALLQYDAAPARPRFDWSRSISRPPLSFARQQLVPAVVLFSIIVGSP